MRAQPAPALLEYVVTVEFFDGAVQVPVRASTKPQARLTALGHPACSKYGKSLIAIFVTAAPTTSF